MKVIVGVVVCRDNKILMVQEAKKKAYGMWNFPSGNIEEKEDIFLAAKREVKEETGYDIELTNLLAIYNKTTSDQSVITIRFLGKIVGGNIKFNKEEILNVNWLSIEKIKSIKKEQLRNYDINIDTIKLFEQNKKFPLDIIKNF